MNISYRCTRPFAEPPASARTSSVDTMLKSPGIVCLRAEAATANSSASPWVFIVSSPWIIPPENESPPPTRSIMGLTS